MIFNQTNKNAGNVNNHLPGGLSFRGKFLAELFSPDGQRLWRKRVRNSVLDPALDDILQVYFAGGTPKTSWFLGLIDNQSFTGVDGGDSLLSHPGWLENINYSQGARAAWSPSIGGGLASNAASQAFTFTKGVSLAGMFVASNSTKGGTSGLLWSAGLFGQPKAVAAGQILRLSYQLRAAGGG